MKVLLSIANVKDKVKATHQAQWTGYTGHTHADPAVEIDIPEDLLVLLKSQPGYSIYWDDDGFLVVE